MTSSLGRPTDGAAETRFSSQAGLASLRAGTTAVRCGTCGAGFASSDATLVLEHLADGSHRASAQTSQGVIGIGGRNK